MKLKYLLGIILVLVAVAPFASALSKPIAGHLNLADPTTLYNVRVFVEVNIPWGDTEICVTAPTVKTGVGGDFATDVANLRMGEFLDVSCNSFAQTGNPIWYEAELDGEIYTSSKEAIETGTGVQFLESLQIGTGSAESPVITSESPSSSDSSDGGSGSSTATNVVKPEPTLEARLTLYPLDNLLKAAISLQSLKASPEDVSLKVILTSLPNEDKSEVIEDEFLLAGSKESEYIFNIESLSDGLYKVQALVYKENELQAVSNKEQFLVVNRLYREPTYPTQTVQEQQPTVVQQSDSVSMLLQIILLLIILILVAKILLLLRKRKNQNLSESENQ